MVVATIVPAAFMFRLSRRPDPIRGEVSKPLFAAAFIAFILANVAAHTALANLEARSWEQAIPGPPPN
jgi:hypothetical protein